MQLENILFEPDDFIFSKSLKSNQKTERLIDVNDMQLLNINLVL